MSRAEKIKLRLQEEVKNGAHYEAQQTYKATFYRYSGKNAHTDAQALLRDGTKAQLQHHQLTCGSELFNMLIQSYWDTETNVDEAKLTEINEYLELITKVEGPESKAVILELRRCAGKCLQWCRQYGDRQDARSIHGVTGGLVFKVMGPMGLGEAAMYLRHSSDMAAFAKAVQESSKAAGDTERDLFTTRAVLQVLSCATKASSVTQLQSARELWRCLSPAQSASSPLDHFVELLLACLGKLSKGVFDQLCAVYRPALEGDEEFVGMLGGVHDAFFGSNKNSGGLGKLMEQLLGGGG